MRRRRVDEEDNLLEGSGVLFCLMCKEYQIPQYSGLQDWPAIGYRGHHLGDIC